MRYNMVNSSEGDSTIVILHDNGDSDIITATHPNYVRIAEGLLRGEDVTEWLRPTTDWFAAQYDEYDEDDDDWDVSGDWDDDDSDFDPYEAIESLSDTIERYRREGRDATGLVRFMQRLERNPSRRSREQLFQWTQVKNLTVDLDGYIVGYKGVRARTEGSDLFPLDKYPYCSSSRGHGIVDGIEIDDDHLPMGVGSVLSIPRDEVQDDPTIGCHVGLHVGTYDYAKGFAPVLVEVRFDPADVVSVPTDCGFQKLRCCRYEVVAVHDLDADDLTAYEAEATWDEQAAFDSFVEHVPQSFLDRIKSRVLSRGKS